MNKAKGFILGAGGFSKEVYALINKVFGRNYVIFMGHASNNIDDVGQVVGKSKVIMTQSDIIKIQDDIVLWIGTGRPQLNCKIIERFQQRTDIQYPNVISPNSVCDWKEHRIDNEVSLGKGNIVTDGVVFTVNINVGSFNVFNLNTTIGHDTVIGDYNVFNPSCSISGNVKIGNRVLVGTGARILENLSICDDVTIGAGAVVTKDITQPGTYVGVPAKKI